MIEDLRPSFAVCAIFVWLLFRLDNITHHSDIISRKNIHFVELPTWFGRQISRVLYLFLGPRIVNHYHRNGLPVAVPTPEAYYIHVSSKEHVQELLGAPEDVLSLHALSKVMLKPEYTMNGLDVSDDMTANGSAHMRALGTLLRKNLDLLEPAVLQNMGNALEAQIPNPTSSNDWVELRVFDLARSMVVAGNSVAFFGAELTAQESFVDAAFQYPQDLFTTAEVLRMLPSFMAPYIGPKLMHHHKASQTLLDTLSPVILQRLGDLKNNTGERSVDVMQFFIESMLKDRRTEWPVTKIISVILGMWFASIHQPALTLVYAINDLCYHAEYVDILRRELDDLAPGDSLERLHIMDAFLKESARLSPSDSISCRRQAVKPFTFADGTHVQAGEVVCVPSTQIMLDNRLYPNSHIFDPYRFVKHGRVTNGERFADATEKYPLWSLGRHVCPGRHFASRSLKVALSVLLRNYDLKMKDGDEGNWKKFNWRSSTIPRPTATILLRKRA